MRVAAADMPSLPEDPTALVDSVVEVVGESAEHLLAGSWAALAKPKGARDVPAGGNSLA